ncbi:Spherulation-specific family 4-domain-containing protein [Bisporella sp. PMI_857]|nr:Spherulation-specific family 4-domain-containing protein [Bisporella sp. PMI_857]
MGLTFAAIGNKYGLNLCSSCPFYLVVRSPSYLDLFKLRVPSSFDFDAESTVKMVNSAYVFLPLYIYPFNQSWDAVTTAIAANPDLNFQIVISPHLANIYPDSNYIYGLDSLNKFPNVQTLGYVHTSWTARNITQVKSEIDSYAAWVNYTDAAIAVDGIFFDETPSGFIGDTWAYLESITSYARRALGPSKTHIALNPGVPVNQSFYELADSINIFENTYAAFNWTSLDFLDWDLLAKSTYAIHSFTGDEEEQRDLISNLSDSNVGGFLITTSPGYTELSGLWAEFCQELNDYEGDPDGDEDDDDDDDEGDDDGNEGDDEDGGCDGEGDDADKDEGDNDEEEDEGE